MKNKSSVPLRKLTALFASLTLSMIFMPTALAQGNLQKLAPQIEIIQSRYAAIPAPQVEFLSTRIEYDAEVEGIKGLKLHINFIVRDANCTPCRTTAYFYDDSDGTALDGSYPAYTDAAGKVSVGNHFTPDVNPAQYKDFTLWIPYRALNLEQDSGNEFNLRFQLYVRDSGKALRTIGKSNYYPFSLKFR
jgi:hypothetical protein